MSEFNSFAETIERARERGRQDVLDVVRAALPATEADHIESRVRKAATPVAPAVLRTDASCHAYRKQLEAGR